MGIVNDRRVSPNIAQYRAMSRNIAHYRALIAHPRPGGGNGGGPAFLCFPVARFPPPIRTSLALSAPRTAIGAAREGLA